MVASETLLATMATVGPVLEQVTSPGSNVMDRDPPDVLCWASVVDVQPVSRNRSRTRHWALLPVSTLMYSSGFGSLDSASATTIPSTGTRCPPAGKPGPETIAEQETLKLTVVLLYLV